LTATGQLCLCFNEVFLDHNNLYIQTWKKEKDNEKEPDINRIFGFSRLWNDNFYGLREEKNSN